MTDAAMRTRGGSAGGDIGPSRARLSPTSVGVIGVALTATLALVVWSFSPGAKYLSHRAGGNHPSGVAMIAWFSLAWLLMTIATMLPTALPLVTAFRRISAGRRRVGQLIVALIAGFLCVWLLAGIALSGVDLFVHRAAESDALRERAWIILAVTLAGAGGYQLSSLAGRCLHACRTPMGFLARHWSGGQRARTQSWNIGVDYGVSCIGCCAALMVVMFAVGMANPLWMVLLGAVSGLHKLAPHGRALAVVTGWVLLACAAFVVVRHTTGTG